MRTPSKTKRFMWIIVIAAVFTSEPSVAGVPEQSHEMSISRSNAATNIDRHEQGARHESARRHEQGARHESGRRHERHEF